MKARIIIIAVLTLLVQSLFGFLGFLVGLAVAGFYLGYTRAWEVVTPQEAARIIEDEDD